MKLLMLVCLFLFILSTNCHSKAIKDQEDDNDEEEDVEEQREFIDELLEVIKKQIKNVSCVDLPESGWNEPKNYLLIKSAQLLGLQHFYRDGDPHVYAIENGSIMIMDSRFVIDDAEGRFSFTINSNKVPKLLKPLLHFHFTIERMKFGIKLYFNPVAQILNITKFQMDEFRGLDVTVAGLGPFNPTIEKMVTITSDILENLVTKYISDTIEQFTQSSVYHVPMIL